MRHVKALQRLLTSVRTDGAAMKHNRWTHDCAPGRGGRQERNSYAVACFARGRVAFGLD